MRAARPAEAYWSAPSATAARDTVRQVEYRVLQPVLRCLVTGVWLLSVVGAAAAHKMLSEGAGEPI